MQAKAEGVAYTRGLSSGDITMERNRLIPHVSDLVVHCLLIYNDPSSKFEGVEHLLQQLRRKEENVLFIVCLVQEDILLPNKHIINGLLYIVMDRPAITIIPIMRIIN